MPATLFCLVKGNTSTNAFSVKINWDEPISELKKLIRAEKAPRFNDIPADELKLWKVKIPDDHDSELAIPALDVELLATRYVEDYWTKKSPPPKRHIHVIVEPPVSTTTSNREQELLDQLALLRTQLNKSVHGTYLYKNFLAENRSLMGTIRLYSEKRF